MRHTGPALSAFNAWVLTKGLETMALRVNHSSASALRLAEWLEEQPAVSWVKYPLLPSHPQYELAARQMKAGGTVLTFELAPSAGRSAKEAAFALLDALRIIDISNNLGDSKSLITHPATTTHRAMGPGGPGGDRAQRRRCAAFRGPRGRRGPHPRPGPGAEAGLGPLPFRE